MHAAHELCNFSTYGEYASQALHDSFMVAEEDVAVPAQEFSVEENKNREESPLE